MKVNTYTLEMSTETSTTMEKLIINFEVFRLARQEYTFSKLVQKINAWLQDMGARDYHIEELIMPNLPTQLRLIGDDEKVPNIRVTLESAPQGVEISVIKKKSTTNYNVELQKQEDC